MSQQATEAIRRLKLISDIDAKRSAADHFKLPAFLSTAVDTSIAGLSAEEFTTGPAEGARAKAVGTRREALEALETDLRGGHAFIAAIDHTEITAAERLGLFESYGWASGELGRFDDERRIALGKQAVRLAEGEAIPAARRYTGARLARIQASLALIEAESDLATGGGRQLAVHRRDQILEEAETVISRVRFYYCCASSDTDQTPELARIEFQPRRDWGTVSSSAGEKPTEEGSETSGSAPKGEPVALPS